MKTYTSKSPTHDANLSSPFRAPSPVAMSQDVERQRAEVSGILHHEPAAGYRTNKRPVVRKSTVTSRQVIASQPARMTNFFPIPPQSAVERNGMNPVGRAEYPVDFVGPLQPGQTTSAKSTIPRRARFGQSSAPDVQHSGGFRTKLAAGIQAAGMGLPFPERERRSLECASGCNLSDVRVFDNRASHYTADLLNARAFTIGRSIYFGRNEYQPTTSNGRELLAHEAAHTIQQRGSSMPALEQLSIGKPNSAAEKDADAFARVFRHGAQVGTPSATDGQQLAAHGASASAILQKPITSSAEIMRVPRVDERMPDDLLGSARYVFPGGGLGVLHEVTPLDQTPTNPEGHPTLQYNDHENGWTEFQSGVDANYSGWGSFVDVQYAHYPSREYTDRHTDSNLLYFGRLSTSAVGFTDTALVNEDWVLGATNLYYEKKNARNDEVLEHGMVQGWFTVEGAKTFTPGDAVTGIGVAGSVASIAGLVAMFAK